MHYSDDSSNEGGILEEHDNNNAAISKSFSQKLMITAFSPLSRPPAPPDIESFEVYAIKGPELEPSCLADIKCPKVTLQR